MWAARVRGIARIAWSYSLWVAARLTPLRPRCQDQSCRGRVEGALVFMVMPGRDANGLRVLCPPCQRRHYQRILRRLHVLELRHGTKGV